MRHGKTHNHLGRKTAHRHAMLSNMASSLILHKRIETTLAKAKELRRYVEPLLTKAKVDSTHSRRLVFSHLQSKEVVKELFDNVSEKIANRPGGYTRIIKLGIRYGDNADLCLIELVDYNELMLTEAKPAKARTRRSRRGPGTGTVSLVGTTATVAELASEAPSQEPLEASSELTYVDSEPVSETTAQDLVSQAEEGQTSEDVVGNAEGGVTGEAPASDDEPAAQV